MLFVICTCSILLLLLLIVVVSSFDYTKDNLPLSPSTSSILFCHPNHLNVLLYYMNPLFESSLWSSSFIHYPFSTHVQTISLFCYSGQCSENLSSDNSSSLSFTSLVHCPLFWMVDPKYLNPSVFSTSSPWSFILTPMSLSVTHVFCLASTSFIHLLSRAGLHLSTLSSTCSILSL